MKREVLFYRKSSGGCPIEEFLDILPAKAARKLVWVLNLAEDLDRVPAHHFCKLTDTDDIWEFRVKSGSNIFRVFAFWDDSRIVLTHGFIKKTQKRRGRKSKWPKILKRIISRENREVNEDERPEKIYSEKKTRR